MLKWLGILLGALRSAVRCRRDLALENLALRQQLAVLKRAYPRPRLTRADRLFWVLASRLWSGSEIIQLIRRMCRANPLWGAPRIHGELLMLGIDISETTVAKYMVKRGGPP